VSAPAAPGALSVAIAAGGLAVIPTDTVYGLCCDAQNPAAVERVAALKGRSSDKPAAVAFFVLEPALAAMPELGERTVAAVRRLLPGALTLLLPNPEARFPLAGGELLGVRVIDCPLQPGRPVLLTSANLAGGADPSRIEDVPAAIRSAAALSIDHGVLPGTPSTVLDLGEYESTGSWRIVRQGAFTRAAVERALVGS
jgi:L-threonylcarbamoyladenylate synthase